MSKIVSIGTATPPHRHEQPGILRFMERIYALPETEKRKLRYLYHQGGIRIRHSVISDYSLPGNEWTFYPHTENLEPFPGLEQRMAWFNRYAAPLSVDAIRDCIAGRIEPRGITHLITVSCTGMSAPGLDLQVAELLNLPRNVFRTSVNFMGCYAAVHGLKLADAIAGNTPGARVVVVCTELCTLHFQREPTPDNMMSSLLFADGSAAALVVSDDYEDREYTDQKHSDDGDISRSSTHPGNKPRSRPLHLSSFYSEIISRGKKDMAWELSSTGFRMTLSGYIPDLVEEDFAGLVDSALRHHRARHPNEREASPQQVQTPLQEQTPLLQAQTLPVITDWCIHPGGRKILESISKAMRLEPAALAHSYEVLAEYGNMSSATILFVLQRILRGLDGDRPHTVFGAAFGPGLTMETFMAKT